MMEERHLRQYPFIAAGRVLRRARNAREGRGALSTRGIAAGTRAAVDIPAGRDAAEDVRPLLSTRALLTSSSKRARFTRPVARRYAAVSRRLSPRHSRARRRKSNASKQTRTSTPKNRLNALTGEPDGYTRPRANGHHPAYLAYYEEIVAPPEESSCQSPHSLSRLIRTRQLVK